MNKGQCLIGNESDRDDICKGISEIQYRGIILNMKLCTCISYGSNIKADSKMFAHNRHDRKIERQKARFPRILFQEYEINRNRWMVLYFSSFFKLLADVYAHVHDM